MGNIKFLLQFLKSPSSVGALAPSSSFLRKKMLEPIDFYHADVIVEFGPGTGVFTKELVRQKKENAILILIEFNKFFYKQLKRIFKAEKNVFIFKESAENLKKILTDLHIDKVDYIVSGLPFASLPPQVSEKILKDSSMSLKQHGSFITFQYSLLKNNLFSSNFAKVERSRELLNFPPAYVLRCSH